MWPNSEYKEIGFAYRFIFGRILRLDEAPGARWPKLDKEDIKKFVASTIAGAQAMAPDAKAFEIREKQICDFGRLAQGVTNLAWYQNPYINKADCTGVLAERIERAGYYYWGTIDMRHKDTQVNISE